MVCIQEYFALIAGLMFSEIREISDGKLFHTDAVRHYYKFKAIKSLGKATLLAI